MMTVLACSDAARPTGRLVNILTGAECPASAVSDLLSADSVGRDRLLRHASWRGYLSSAGAASAADLPTTDLGTFPRLAGFVGRSTRPKKLVADLYLLLAAAKQQGQIVSAPLAFARIENRDLVARPAQKHTFLPALVSHLPPQDRDKVRLDSLPGPPGLLIVDFLKVVASLRPTGRGSTCRDYCNRLLAHLVAMRGTAALALVTDNPEFVTPAKQAKHVERSAHVKDSVSVALAADSLCATLDSPFTGAHHDAFKLLEGRPGKRRLCTMFADWVRQQDPSVLLFGFDDRLHGEADTGMFYALSAGVWNGHGSVVVDASDSDCVIVALLHQSHSGERPLDLFVQSHRNPNKYWDIGALVRSVCANLSFLPDPCATVAALFALSGCDYVEGTARCPAARYVAAFFQHAQLVGSLASRQSDGILQWGMDAWKRLYAALAYSHNAIPSLPPLAELWQFADHDVSRLLSSIRIPVLARLDATNLERAVPSDAAIELHGKRAEFALRLLASSHVAHPTVYSEYLEFGWVQEPDEAPRMRFLPDDEAKRFAEETAIKKGCSCSNGCGKSCRSCRGIRLCTNRCKCGGCCAWNREQAAEMAGTVDSSDSENESHTDVEDCPSQSEPEQVDQAWTDDDDVVDGVDGDDDEEFI